MTVRLCPLLPFVALTLSACAHLPAPDHDHDPLERGAEQIFSAFDHTGVDRMGITKVSSSPAPTAGNIAPT